MKLRKLTQYGNRNKLELQLNEETTEINRNTGYAVELLGGKMEVLTGTSKKRTDNADEAESGELILPAQRLVKLSLGTVYSRQYHIQFEPSHQLVGKAEVSLVNLVEPGNRQDIELFIRPRVNIPLSDLDWVVRIYLGE